MKMYRASQTAAVCFLSLATAAAVAQPAPKPLLQGGDADAAFAVSGKFSEPTGQKLFERVCAACHMPDARGATGAGTYPSLAKNPKLAIRVYPVNVVMKGLNGMPPFATMMSDTQVADVVNYVRGNFGNSYKDAVTPEQAKSLR